MSSTPISLINLELLPDWAKETSFKRPSIAPEKSPRKTGHSNRERIPHRQHLQEKNRQTRTSYRPETSATSSLANIKILFLPESNALQSVVEQIRTSIRAYPLFGLARMFLEKPERYLADLQSYPTGEDKIPKPLYQCKMCESIALNETRILAHIFKEHQDLFYQKKQESVETPKGSFSSVVRCQLNGAILGPVNHHAYQENLMRLYKMEFRHLSFERFKQSMITVRDPEAIKKWQEGASQKTTYICLQVSEPKVLSSMEEVERHFRQTHFEKATRQSPEFTMSSDILHKLDDSTLVAEIRSVWESERRFPRNFSNQLRKSFLKMGLQVFRGKKGMLFVSLVHPKPLVADTLNVSKIICDILAFIKANPGYDRKKVLEAISPPLTPSVSSNEITKTSTSECAPTSSLILQDLYWLIREGYVIEYNHGGLEVVKMPLLKPLKSPSSLSPASPMEPPPKNSEIP